MKHTEPSCPIERQNATVAKKKLRAQSSLTPAPPKRPFECSLAHTKHRKLLWQRALPAQPKDFTFQSMATRRPKISEDVRQEFDKGFPQWQPQRTLPATQVLVPSEPTSQD